MSSISFNHSNADLKVRSSDGVEFDLHRTVLATHTGAFPGPEIDTGGEVVDLTEPANVLRICFDFVYPKRHPDLEDIEDFDLLAAVAEAVGKYEIFCAVNTCNMRLRSFLPLHPTPILMYAIKHDHPKLINEAAEYLVLSSFISVLKQIPPSYTVAWSLYHDAWMEVSKKAFREILSLYASSNPQCHAAVYEAARSKPFSWRQEALETAPRTICTTCKCSLFTWVLTLEGMNGVSALKESVHVAWEKGVTSLPCCATSQGKNASCAHMVNLAKFCQRQIPEIPPFTSFIKGTI